MKISTFFRPLIFSAAMIMATGITTFAQEKDQQQETSSTSLPLKGEFILDKSVLTPAAPFGPNYFLRTSSLALSSENIYKTDLDLRQIFNNEELQKTPVHRTPTFMPIQSVLGFSNIGGQTFRHYQLGSTSLRQINTFDLQGNLSNTTLQLNLWSTK